MRKRENSTPRWVILTENGDLSTIGKNKVLSRDVLINILMVWFNSWDWVPRLYLKQVLNDGN